MNMILHGVESPNIIHKNTLEDNVVLSNSMGINQAKSKHFFLERYEKAFRNELLHFIKSLQSGTKPSVDISDRVLK